MNRRQFISAFSAVAASSLLIPSITFASDKESFEHDAEYRSFNDFWEKPRELWLYREQTKENIRACYYRNGEIDLDGYKKISWILRDTAENKAVYMDTQLMDILRGVYGYFINYGYDQPLIIKSGYRTFKTNQRGAKEGTAKNSYHLKGRAVDVHAPGIPDWYVANLGLYFKKGGVGVYPKRDFTHLDTGPQRFWKA